MKTLKTILILSMLFNLNIFYQFNKTIEYQRNYEIKSEVEIHNMLMREKETTKDKIIRLARINNFDEETALRVAECESQYGKYPYNWTGSSAKGVYQITDRTWENYCEGNVLNEVDNIKCFLKLYNQHSSWWECS